MKLTHWIWTAGLLALLSCHPSTPLPPPASQTPPSPQPLILYNWVDYMPQSILDGFSADTASR